MADPKPTVQELFAPFNDAHGKVSAAEEAIASLIKDRNQHIEAIAKAYGAGPWKLRDGKVVKFQRHPRTKEYGVIPVDEPTEV